MRTLHRDHDDPDRWEATRVNWGANMLDLADDVLLAAARTGWPVWVLLDPNVPLPEVRFIPVGLLARRIRARLDAGGFVRR